MKSFVVGINQEKNESNSIQMAPESAIKGSIKFLMNRDGNNEFRNKTLLENWIGFKASGSVYAVSWVLKVLKYNDKKVPHPGNDHLDFIKIIKLHLGCIMRD